MHCVTQNWVIIIIYSWVVIVRILQTPPHPNWAGLHGFGLELTDPTRECGTGPLTLSKINLITWLLGTMTALSQAPPPIMPCYLPGWTKAHKEDAEISLPQSTGRRRAASLESQASGLGWLTLTRPGDIGWWMHALPLPLLG